VTCAVVLAVTCGVWEVCWSVRCVFCVFGFIVFEVSACVSCQYGLCLPA